MAPKAKHLPWAVAFAAALPISALAQSDPAYPSKPVRLVVGFTPGSATDLTARIFAQRFTEAMNASFAVENVPGAAGTLGAVKIAKSPADGYNLYFGANGAMTIAPSLLTKLQFDPVTDFAPVGLFLTMPSILAVNNDVPANSIRSR